MIAVVQRVRRAAVTVDEQPVGQIGLGLAVLLAVEQTDTASEETWMADKLAGLRIFPSEDGARPFDQDVRGVGGAVLLVSNFTVAAQTAKGRRPSLEAAAKPEPAAVAFNRVVDLLRSQGVTVEIGRFGADMLVSLDNDGPVTFIVQTPRH